jgi:hypothetical protein
MYNREMVKRLEHDTIGQGFWHALQSPTGELVQHFQGRRCVSLSSTDCTCQFLPSKPLCSNFCPMPNGRTSCSTIWSR